MTYDKMEKSKRRLSHAKIRSMVIAVAVSLLLKVKRLNEDLSTPRYLLPLLMALISVVPLPANKSQTISSFCEHERIILSKSSSGF